MLSLFRNNQISNSFLFLFYLLLFRGVSYFAPKVRKDSVFDGGYFSEILGGWFGDSFWLQEGFTIALLLFHAVLLTYIVMEHRLGRDVSLFPGVFYLLIMSSSIYFLPLNDVLLGNTFLIFALIAILNTYRVPSCADTIFNIGFWIAISTFFNLSNVVFLFWAIFGLNFMRALRLKEILAVLVGFCVPYILAMAYYFWNDQFVSFVQGHFYKYSSITDFYLTENLGVNVALGFLMLIVVITVTNSGEFFKKKSIQVQKRIGVFFLFLLTSLFSIFFQHQLGITDALVAAVPLSAIVAFFFLDLKKRTAEAAHWVWVIVALVLQLRPIFFA